MPQRVRRQLQPRRGGDEPHAAIGRAPTAAHRPGSPTGPLPVRCESLWGAAGRARIRVRTDAGSARGFRRDDARAVQLAQRRPRRKYTTGTAPAALTTVMAAAHPALEPRTRRAGRCARSINAAIFKPASTAPASSIARRSRGSRSLQRRLSMAAMYAQRRLGDATFSSRLPAATSRRRQRLLVSIPGSMTRGSSPGLLARNSRPRTSLRADADRILTASVRASGGHLRLGYGDGASSRKQQRTPGAPSARGRVYAQ